MALDPYLLLARLVLALHLAVVAFNLFGLVAVPLGAWRGWRFVRIFWWRALHLGALACVAVQALLGRACFLTYWQGGLLEAAGEAGETQPLLWRWANRLLFWPLPLWVFTLIYLAVLAYGLALWWWVRPQRRRQAQP
jgi:hypothetical protein